MEPKVMYQLWLYYAIKGKWRMEGFYDSKDEADNAYQILRADPTIRCIDDVEVVQVTVMRP